MFLLLYSYFLVAESEEEYSSCKNPMKIMKRQKDMIPEDEHPGQKVSNTLLEKSRGQLLIDPGE